LRRCGDTSAGLRIKPAFLNTEAVADLNPAAAFCRASGIPGPRLAYGISDDDTERGGHPSQKAMPAILTTNEERDVDARTVG
jgi:hypothetical protein